MSETEDIQVEGPYVVGFDDAGATERALVGGKGANLAQLVGAGLPVPAGFCVTTAAYEVLIDEPVIEDAINELAALDPTDTAAIADTGAALRARIQDCDVPDEIRAAIERALDSTANDTEAVYAIRSSATAEDLPEASFAGQQETFLNVHREEITDRVRACMASLFTDRAIAYRARNDIPHEEVAIAVVVQRMITPDSSGILFTADPQTGNRHIASIDAGLGLGEALVSGEVTADNVRFDTRTGEVLDYESGDQQVAVRPLPEGGTETVELSQEERASHVLSDEQIQTLVEFGKEIEALFECPQDIEWCLADGEFSIVQARPITSLFPLPSPAPADDRLHVYLSIGHAQAFPEAMPPLVRDIWRTYTHTLLGLNTDSRFVVEAGGRIYVNLTPFLRSNTVRQRLLDLLSTMSEPAAAGLDDLLTRREEAFRDGRGWFETIAMGPTLVGAVWTGAKTSLPLIRKYIDGFGGAFSGEPTPEREEDLWDACGRQLAAQMRAPETPADRARAAFDLLTTETLVSAIPRMGPLVAAFAVGGSSDGSRSRQRMSTPLAGVFRTNW